MGSANQMLVTFLVNAIWQIPVITIVAACCSVMLRRMPSRYTHKVWALALVSCSIVPLITVLMQTTSTMPRIAPADDAITSSATNILRTKAAHSFPFHSLSHPLPFPAALLNVLLWVYGALLLFEVLRLGWAHHRTAQLRKSAYNRPMTETLSQVAERCARAFSLPGTPVLCSPSGIGPLTVGFWHPVLILPEEFFTDRLSEQDLCCGLSHELAHIRRRDYLFNLLLAIVSLPVRLHPCTLLITAKVAQTRELACDELAASTLLSGAQYARSLLHIAQSMFSLTQRRSGHALGLFDTNTMEERIVNILKVKTESQKWTRVLRLIAALLVGATALGVCAFSLRVAASDTPAEMAQFAGTWETKYQGRTFFTIKLALNNGAMTGSCTHVGRVAYVDGELIPDFDATSSTGNIIEPHAAGQKLTLRCTNGPSDTGIPLEFKLTGKNQADVRNIVEGPSDVPPQKKPWHFQRIGNTL